MAEVTPLRATHHPIAVAAQPVKKATKRTKIKLTTTLQPIMGVDGAMALASIKRRKKRKRYLRELERVLTENAYPRKYLRPLEKYLIQKIREGQTNLHICFSSGVYEKNC